MNTAPEKKFILIIPDGAADRHRTNGRSPLTAARIDNSHFIAREGVCGLLQTLYPDLSKSSIVAQLGMFGWDPYTYYPHGRASYELLALDDVELGEGDLVFRANLVTMRGCRLESYNGGYILSEQSSALIEKINSAARDCFPAFELYHNSDFRNSLVIRDARVDPRVFICAEPHENEGVDFDLDGLICARDASAARLAQVINECLACAAAVLAGEAANMLFLGALHCLWRCRPSRTTRGFRARLEWSAVWISCAASQKPEPWIFTRSATVVRIRIMPPRAPG